VENDKEMKKQRSELPVDSTITRREFITRLGGGIVVLFSVGDLPSLFQQRRRREYPDDFNAFLRIGMDGRVSCFPGKIEMGQGIITSLAQMLAEELEVPVESIDMVMVDTDLCVYDSATVGSRTTRYLGPALRGAAMEAREVLLELASEHLKVPVNQLKTENGTVYHNSQSSKKVTYAQLAKGKAIERHLDKKPDLKDKSQFKIMGKPFYRRDSIEKVTGNAKFSGDFRLPGMLYAKIVRPPAHGAQLKSIDTSEAEKMKGLRVVRDDDLIAVLHKNPDEAEKALKTIKVQFEKPEAKVDDKTIFAHMLNLAPDGDVVAEEGNILTGENFASEVFDETYYNSYVAHAPIETHTSLAKVENSKAILWVATQGPFGVRGEIARALNFPE